jgi:hypothetical protein
MRMTHALGLALVGLCGLGCKEKAPPPRVCCEQPEIPAGVPKFNVVGDDVIGPSDGEKVLVRAALSQPVKRDALYPVMHTLYRHAMKRTAFEPIQYAASVYADEGAARSGGDQWVARIWREPGQGGPRCEIRQKYDLEEKAERAFLSTQGNLPEEDPNDSCHLAEKKKAVAKPAGPTPRYELDGGRRAVTITHPYLEMDRPEWVAELTYSAAMRDFADYMTTFFSRIEELSELTFVGVHKEQPVVNITVTRAQFDGGLSNLQEQIAGHAAVTFAKLGAHQDDKGVAKEQAQFHAKTYKAALASLPKNQVTVSPKLK